MKVYGNFFLLTSSLLFSTTTFAFLCPKNFNQIDFGYSVAQVEELCGAPDKKEVTDAPDTSPQEWVYFLPQSGFANPNGNAMGTLRTSIALDGEGKVMNITINNISVSSMTNCGTAVSIGDSRQTVESACGKPGVVNKSTPTASSGQPADDANKQIEMTYNSTPPVTLIFIKGKLTDKR